MLLCKAQNLCRHVTCYPLCEWKKTSKELALSEHKKREDKSRKNLLRALVRIRHLFHEE